ncbi:hypothetical protein LXL04_028975 [Taraxacum kok-saghyz]
MVFTSQQLTGKQVEAAGKLLLPVLGVWKKTAKLKNRIDSADPKLKKPKPKRTETEKNRNRVLAVRALHRPRPADQASPTPTPVPLQLRRYSPSWLHLFSPSQLHERLILRFQIPSRTTITQDVLDIYVSEAGKLKNYFTKNKQRVSLTTDLWSSRRNLSYMCLTAPFIDKDWIIHKRILNSCPISGHSGEIIGKYLKKSLFDWGLDKVFTITVDNASSNDLCIHYLKRRLNAWKHSVLDSQYLHMRCCAHILSLVIKDGLKDVN